MGRALIDVTDQGGPAPRLRAVQAEGCAPLAGAWRRALALTGGPDTAAQHWDDCMRVWGSDGEAEPASLADGILDDETYDWIGIVQALVATDGDVVVASEAQVVEAHQLLRDTTGIDATATGTAGLAGVLAARSGGDARVAVVASGVTRY
jgi:threonine synthase